MKKNMGTVDRVIRFTAAVVVGVLLVTGTLHGVLGIILGVLAIIWLVTSVISFCPLYVLLKISTCSCKCENK